MPSDDSHQKIGVGKGSERNKTAFTMLRIAVFATPKARESTATMVNRDSSKAPVGHIAYPAMTLVIAHH